ncbi:hypothetical protein R1sor_016925 [Riccia sorocarpa]|uniref:Integrase catalytic domain-containing protein n=1 Tax=Riccia sorocarpa TaxID=122646 RepID=A0ABD3HI90_9MARC
MRTPLPVHEPLPPRGGNIQTTRGIPAYPPGFSNTNAAPGLEKVVPDSQDPNQEFPGFSDLLQGHQEFTTLHDEHEGPPAEPETASETGPIPNLEEFRRSVPYLQEIAKNNITPQAAKFNIVKEMATTPICLTQKQILELCPSQVKLLRDHLNTMMKTPNANPQGVQPAQDMTNPPSKITNLMRIRLFDPVCACVINGFQVAGVKIDSGAAVNIMSKCLMEKLHLGPLKHTRRVLQMADGRKTYPLGKLREVPTTVGGIAYNVTYLVVEAKADTPVDFDLLFGMKWLLQASARTWWKEVIIEIGPVDNPIRLQMYNIDGTPVNMRSEEIRQVYDWHPLQDEVDDLDSVMASCCMITSTKTRERKIPGTREYESLLRVTCPARSDTDKITLELREKGSSQICTDSPELKILDLADKQQTISGLEDQPELTPEQLQNYFNKVRPEDPVETRPLHLPVMDKLQKLDISRDNEDPKYVFISDATSEDDQKRYQELCKQYRYVFAYSYEELLGVFPDRCQHRIPMIPDHVPYRQRPYRLLEHWRKQVKEELTKLENCKFIYPAQECEWASPILVVPKKNTGKIRICVDFKKLNHYTIPDLFPIPFSDLILYKTTFVADWGTYAYRVMPFGLQNAPATFQRYMMESFVSLKPFVELYLDDICTHTIPSEHLKALEEVLQHCRTARISLNPQKCQFVCICGRLLGHIITENGIMVDPEKITIIVSLPTPQSATEVRSFLGMTGYYKGYVHMYAHITAPLSPLTGKLSPEYPPRPLSNEEKKEIKKLPKWQKPRKAKLKDVPFIWTPDCQKAFEFLKEKLVTAPILIAPNWDKDFHVLVDTSLLATGAILAQLDDKSKEHPIHYASRQLSQSESKYSTTERECLGMIYAVSKFQHYLLGKTFVFHVDHEALKYINRYFLDTSPKDNFLFLITDVTTEDNWIMQFKSYLLTQQFPLGLPMNYWGSFEFAAASFRLLEGDLYRVGRDLVQRRCVFPEEVYNVVRSCHSDPSGGHFQHDATICKVYTTGYWWPTVSRDVRAFVRSCDECQRYGKPGQSHRMTLTPIITVRPFQKWAIDYMGPFNPPFAITRHEYIIVAVDYVTKWAEVQSVRHADARTTVRFIEDFIIARFGLPISITSDNGRHFVNQAMRHVMASYGIRQNFSTPYHPQANGQVERVNRTLLSTLRKTVDANPKDWDRRLIGALWAYRTTFKTTTGQTPFQLVYGQEAILPIEFMLPTLKVLTGYSWVLNSPQWYKDDPDAPLKERVHQLHLLEETRLVALYQQYINQSRRKVAFDKLSKPLSFKDSRSMINSVNSLGSFQSIGMSLT